MFNPLKKILQSILSISILSLLLVGYSSTAFASSPGQYAEPGKLQLSWTVYENNYLGKEQNRSAITVRNLAAQGFPAQGWKIYFNYGKKMQPIGDLQQLKITHVNGGLYYLSPGKDFKGLVAGAEIAQQYVANSWIVNSSDAPQGFYLVWDDAPAKGIPLQPIVIVPPAAQQKLKRFAADQEPAAEQVYLQNERGRNQKNNAPCAIFPRPLAYQERPGDFVLSPLTKISTDSHFIAEAQLLSAALQPVLGKRIAISSTGLKKQGLIQLKMDTSMATDSYQLVVSASGILISGRSGREILYGIQSLKMLIKPEAYANRPGKKFTRVKCVVVEDRPAFAFRGVMLDVARNFQSKAELFKLIDLLSLYKLTTLHLHLNDDEGWRLQIKALPELTEVGSKRGHTLNEEDHLMPSYGSGPLADVSSGSGFYSRADFVDILKYATQRHINIIPEIETPGHARAAIVSMRARYLKFMKAGDTLNAKSYVLRDEADTSVYRSVQQWNDHVMDVSLPSVYTFLETVTDELISQYQEAGAPLETIHFGGDEVPVGVWTGSPAVNAFKKLHPEVKQAADLWDYYFDRISAMLDKKGLYLSGWEETALRKSTLPGGKKWQPNPLFRDKNFHVNVWNNMAGNEDLAYRLANSGYKVILSFVTNFYFDMAYVRQFDEPGFNWGGFINLEQAYKFIPFDYLRNQHTDYLNRPLPQHMLASFEPLSSKGKQNILGIQGLLWTETVTTAERMEWMYLPRLLALSEKAWSSLPVWASEPDSVKAALAYENDLGRFTTSVSRELKRLDHYGGGYNYRIPVPVILLKNGLLAVNTDLPGFEIRYTTDGSVPNQKSSLYLKPVKPAAHMCFRAFNSLGRGGRVNKFTAPQAALPQTMNNAKD